MAKLASHVLSASIIPPAGLDVDVEPLEVEEVAVEVDVGEEEEEEESLADFKLLYIIFSINVAFS